MRGFCYSSVVAVMLVSMGGCGSRPFPAISGLKVDTVRQDLEQQWGMVFGEPYRIKKSWNYVFGSVRDQSTGADLTCEVAYYDNGEVWSVGYTAIWSSASLEPGFNTTTAMLADLSRRYLTYCASISCQGDDAATVTQLVNEVLTRDGVNEDKLLGQVHVTIGSHSSVHFNELNFESAEGKP